MTTGASGSEVATDVTFIRRTGKALVVAGFVALGLTAWVIVGEHRVAGLAGVPVGLLFISYGVDVVGYPHLRRVLGPKATSEWLLTLLARLPGAADAPDAIEQAKGATSATRRLDQPQRHRSRRS